MSGWLGQRPVAQRPKVRTAQHVGRPAQERATAPTAQRERHYPESLLSNSNLRGRRNGSVQIALIQEMQQTHGNRAVQRFLQRAAAGQAASPGVNIGDRIQSRLGSGSRLPIGVQRKLEEGLGTNLSNVRVHTDGEADHLARSVNSVAFTTGSNIFLRSGAYNTDSSDGLRLLAHEAAHTVQQAAGPVACTSAPGGISVSDPSDSYEQAAERAADGVMSSKSAASGHAHGAASSPIQRQAPEGPCDDCPHVSAASTPVQRLARPAGEGQDEQLPAVMVMRASVSSPWVQRLWTGSTPVQRLTAEEKKENLKSAKFAGNARLEQAFDNDPVLSVGANGLHVKLIQEGLVADGFPMPGSTKPTGEMDGIFGSETVEVVKKFQAKHGLLTKDGRADGLVGRKTMGKLDELAGGGGGGGGPTPTPPTPTPPTPTPPTPPAPPTPAAPVVTIGRVRNSSTPAGMPDRIPPRVDTPVDVKVSGIPAGSEPVTLSVASTGGGPGSATINGAAFVTLTADATVQIKGGTQTSPGPGRLRLAANRGGATLATSPPFAVAAIPQNLSFTFKNDITGNNRGFVIDYNWESDTDTKTKADLDQAGLTEQVQKTSGTGVFTTLTLNTSTAGPPTPANGGMIDTHSVGPLAALTSTSSLLLAQTFMFNENRTGATSVPMTNSGYSILHMVLVLGSLFPTTVSSTKTGVATTANGIASGAGAGSLTRNQTIP
jgi:peptidoglycan hydrolase-like protein with peptidoglycan-binding domain